MAGGRPSQLRLSAWHSGQDSGSIRLPIIMGLGLREGQVADKLEGAPKRHEYRGVVKRSPRKKKMAGRAGCGVPGAEGAWKKWAQCRPSRSVVSDTPLAELSKQTVNTDLLLNHGAPHLLKPGGP